MTKAREGRSASVILLSGGLDSAAGLAFCHERDQPVLALTALYGQRAQQRELQAARSLAEYYGVPHESVDLSWLGRLGGSSLTSADRSVPTIATDQLDVLGVIQETAKAVWVPNRNGVLLNVAAAFAERMGATQVVVGFNAEEAVTFPDNSGEFLDRTTQAFAYSTANHLRATCYTTFWDKSQIVAELKKLAKPFPFDRLWSCYLGGERPCGSCESCKRQARAFKAAGVLQ